MTDDVTSPGDAGQGGDAGASAAVDALNGANGASWYGDIEDQELKSWAENKNFPDAQTALKSSFELERMVGKDRMTPPEEGQDLSEWTGWDKLGAPKEAKAYAEHIKPDDYELPEGMAWDQEFMDKAFEIGAANRIPAAQMKPLADMIIEGRKAEFEAAQEVDAQDRKAVDDMYAGWGTQKDANLEHAKRAATALGFDDDLIGEASQHQGSARLIAKLSEVGQKMSEGGLITGAKPAMSREQAQVELDAMKADSQVVEAVMDSGHARHKIEKERYERLSRLSVG